MTSRSPTDWPLTRHQSSSTSQSNPRITWCGCCIMGSMFSKLIWIWFNHDCRSWLQGFECFNHDCKSWLQITIARICIWFNRDCMVAYQLNPMMKFITVHNNLQNMHLLHNAWITYFWRYLWAFVNDNQQIPSSFKLVLYKAFVRSQITDLNKGGLC